MALQVRVTCSNHQKDDRGYGREEEVWLDTIDGATAQKLKKHLERLGWVVQFNGEHMDTYCLQRARDLYEKLTPKE